MADNFAITPGSGGLAATDEVTYSGDVSQVQLVRVVGVTGAEGSKTVTDPPCCYLEDTPHASGAMGKFILAVQQTADVALAGDGDYAPIQVDEIGRVKVANYPASQTATTGSITTNGGQVAINVARTSNIVIGMVATTLVGHNATFEASLNSTNGTDGAWYGIQAVRSNSNTIELTTGTLAATPGYLWECSVNGYNWFRVRATAHTSGTAAYTIQPAPFATEPAPAAQVSGTQPISGTVTANAGTGTMAVSLATNTPTLAAGTNLAADVGIQYRASSAGGASIGHVVSAASTNAANVKASAGRVVGWHFINTSASWRYVKLHNTATAPTAGAGVVATIGVPPNGGTTAFPPGGIGFSTGIGRTIVGGAADADATAIGAAEVVGDLYFA